MLMFKAGDTFLLKRTPQQDDFYHLMNGKFCGEAKRKFCGEAKV